MSATNLKYKDVYFDSDEEVFVAMWAEELCQAGVLRKWEKNTEEKIITQGLKVVYKKKTQLKTKLKVEEKEFTVLRPSVYTTDFVLWPTDSKHFSKLFSQIDLHPIHIEEFNKDAPLFCDSSWTTYVEVKPYFDQNNMERLFVNNQKFLWDKFQMFVNLVEPLELFKKTFLPLLAEPYFKYRKSPTGKNKGKKSVGDWKMDWLPKTINEFLNK